MFVVLSFRSVLFCDIYPRYLVKGYAAPNILRKLSMPVAYICHSFERLKPGCKKGYRPPAPPPPYRCLGLCGVSTQHSNQYWTTHLSPSPLFPPLPHLSPLFASTHPLTIAITAKSAVGYGRGVLGVRKNILKSSGQLVSLTRPLPLTPFPSFLSFSPLFPSCPRTAAISDTSTSAGGGFIVIGFPIAYYTMENPARKPAPLPSFAIRLSPIRLPPTVYRLPYLLLRLLHRFSNSSLFSEGLGRFVWSQK